MTLTQHVNLILLLNDFHQINFYMFSLILQINISIGTLILNSVYYTDDTKLY